MATPNRRTRALASKSHVSYESLVGLMKIVEEQGRPGEHHEYVGRRRQFMSDGRPYDTHNPGHYIEQWGMSSWAARKAGVQVGIRVGVFADTPGKMMMAVIASRS